ncbi:hypothetical protein [Holospora curviuscula]|uniref:hypothetical protein n=1 Tax=Holospora curviuscula TaxID=1082868 RepID=UPI0013FD2730|nr:hypothetical protein [Holospora curviuscula]
MQAIAKFSPQVLENAAGQKVFQPLQSRSSAYLKIFLAIQQTKSTLIPEETFLI